ncbi:hypothetical protein [Clostridium sp. YIM B02569]|uniref:hyaluronate lyase N-terminal domain-containing protein n=1 Tax=Clostridium sp. YIM B02569 TaxID=2911967 RepID=UPI001EEA7184|nr:hypothetical protein [Clostridium sp. YIM B02569]
MSNKIQIKRGLKANLPILDAGEPAFTTDTKEFFVGDGKNNIEFAKQADLEVINNQVSDLNFQTAGGTGTAITLKINQTMTNGLAVTFIASTNNSGAVTTINGKLLYKPNTKTVPNLMAGKAYTVWYNSTGDCFFIKASAEGTALASDVRKNKTFSNDNDTGVVGGLDLSLLVPGNIRAGITIDGVAGKSSVVDTADATVVANHILAGETAYKNGAKVTGTMVDRSGDTACVSSSVSGTTLKLKASEGYRDGANDNVTITDANFIATNIISGKSIFGVVGNASIESLGGRQFKSGSFVGNNGAVTINLPFKPSIVYMYWNYSAANALIKSVLFSVVDPNTFYNLSGTGTSVGSVGNNFFTRNDTGSNTWYWYAWE